MSQPHDRSAPRTSHPARALRGLRTALLGAALAVTLGLGVASAAHPDDADRPGRPAPELSGRASLLARHCGPAEATDALVRTPAGRLRTVSFERGWEMYTGERPGILVGVCRPG